MLLEYWLGTRNYVINFKTKTTKKSRAVLMSFYSRECYDIPIATIWHERVGPIMGSVTSMNLLEGDKPILVT